ncbi:TetR/AcrR family transcriptional regulator [Methanocella sp. CWC-04]|uniref:TetR/AcrR family transcriptional regulator n=1 Tax=Methanooceanicella nereidis TaxID=2052831 RepID=A0AAP2W727_9EURY|nr:TetR/AcrR family transcriptional regulator [Methanocella sp. CWC-04]MCD1294686.1 TetR/AcrR family transcriptional regulator [Methanocella sp. CWC-04]
MGRISKDPEERREDYINAAEELFLEKGYENTSASDIIKKIGLAQGTFYYYFRSKDDILEAVIYRYLERYGSALKNVADNNDINAMDKLQEIIHLSFNLRNNGDALEKYIFESSIARHEKFERNFNALIIPLLAKVVEQGMKEGLFEVDFPMETAEMLVVMLYYSFYSAKRSKDWEERYRKMWVAENLIKKALNARKCSLSLMN